MLVTYSASIWANAQKETPVRLGKERNAHFLGADDALIVNCGDRGGGFWGAKGRAGRPNC